MSGRSTVVVVFALNIWRTLSDSVHSPEGLVLSWSLRRRLVIGGRLRLLSRAALPVLNKNFHAVWLVGSKKRTLV